MRLRRRRLQRDRHLPRVRRRRRRAADRLRGRRRRRRDRPARGEHHRRRARRAARHPVLRAAGRGRPDDRDALDLGRPGLPGRRARARLARTTPAGPRYEPVTDAEAMDAFQLLCRTEGIIPAIESAHALAGALAARRAELGPGRASILVNLSGRGDKDVDTAARVVRRSSTSESSTVERGESRRTASTKAAGRGPGRAGRLPAGRVPDRRRRRSPRCGRWSRPASTSSRSACRTPTR